MTTLALALAEFAAKAVAFALFVYVFMLAPFWPAPLAALAGLL